MLAMIRDHASPGLQRTGLPDTQTLIFCTSINGIQACVLGQERRSPWAEAAADDMGSLALTVEMISDTDKAQSSLTTRRGAEKETLRRLTD